MIRDLRQNFQSRFRYFRGFWDYARIPGILGLGPGSQDFSFQSHLCWRLIKKVLRSTWFLKSGYWQNDYRTASHKSFFRVRKKRQFIWRSTLCSLERAQESYQKSEIGHISQSSRKVFRLCSVQFCTVPSKFWLDYFLRRLMSTQRRARMNSWVIKNKHIVQGPEQNFIRSARIPLILYDVFTIWS